MVQKGKPLPTLIFINIQNLNYYWNEHIPLGSHVLNAQYLQAVLYHVLWTLHVNYLYHKFYDAGNQIFSPLYTEFMPSPLKHLGHCLVPNL